MRVAGSDRLIDLMGNTEEMGGFRFVLVRRG
jgi:hypothetical protein